MRTAVSGPVIRKITIALLSIMAVTLLWVSTAFAIASPTLLQIPTIHGYSNVLETGDKLFIFTYQIEYATIPTDVATSTFMGRFLDGADELQSTAPYAFFNDGYGSGVMSFYFDEAEAIALGITHGGSYTIRLQGSPSFFAVPPVVNNGSIEWQSTLVTKKKLRENMQVIAGALEIVWGVAMVETSPEGDVFSSNGDTYFTNAIPNLRLMAPELFSGRIGTPQFTERDFDTTYIDQLKSFWDNSFLGGVRDQWSSVTKTNGMLLTTIMVVIFNIFIGWVAFKITTRPDFAPLSVAVIWPFAAYMGLTEPALAGIMAALAALGVAWALYLRRA